MMMSVCVGAILAGAVCGDHISPISDTTILSSAGAQCKHIDHVATQMPYALTVHFVQVLDIFCQELQEMDILDLQEQQ